jgi:hypothetical protein
MRSKRQATVRRQFRINISYAYDRNGNIAQDIPTMIVTQKKTDRCNRKFQ